MKPILDVACGSKMFYFDKNDPRVHFNDIRTEEKELLVGVYEGWKLKMRELIECYTPGDIEVIDGVAHGTCPVCGEDVTVIDDPGRCHNCDHFLDWEGYYEE